MSGRATVPRRKGGRLGLREARWWAAAAVCAGLRGWGLWASPCLFRECGGLAGCPGTTHRSPIPTRRPGNDSIPGACALAECRQRLRSLLDRVTLQVRGCSAAFCQRAASDWSVMCECPDSRLCAVCVRSVSGRRFVVRDPLHGNGGAAKGRTMSDQPISAQAISPLHAVESMFRLLTAGTRPLYLDGTDIGYGFPAREIPLDELRVTLLHPACGYAAREEAWRHVVRRARAEGGAWRVGAVGLAMPGLKRIVAKIPAAAPVDFEEVEQEMLAAFLDELAVLDEAEDRIPGRLCWAAHRAARRLWYRACADAGRRASLAESAAPPPPYGHPDLRRPRPGNSTAHPQAPAQLRRRLRLETAQSVPGNRWLHRGVRERSSRTPTVPACLAPWWHQRR